MKPLILMLVTAFVLTGCASVPTEYFSPCACDFKPLKSHKSKGAKAVA